MENTEITYTSAEHQAKADEILTRIGELCAMSLGAYTNPAHEPSYSDISKECAGLVEKYNWHS